FSKRPKRNLVAYLRSNKSHDSITVLDVVRMNLERSQAWQEMKFWWFMCNVHKLRRLIFDYFPTVSDIVRAFCEMLRRQGIKLVGWTNINQIWLRGLGKYWIEAFPPV